MTLHLDSVDIVSLIKQVRYELADKIEASGVDFRFTLPDEKLTLRLDGQKTCRIFENLMVNITKYAMRGTRLIYRPDGRKAVMWLSPCGTSRKMN